MWKKGNERVRQLLIKIEAVGMGQVISLSCKELCAGREGLPRTRLRFPGSGS